MTTITPATPVGGEELVRAGAVIDASGTHFSVRFGPNYCNLAARLCI